MSVLRGLALEDMIGFATPGDATPPQFDAGADGTEGRSSMTHWSSSIRIGDRMVCLSDTSDVSVPTVSQEGVSLEQFSDPHVQRVGGLESRGLDLLIGDDVIAFIGILTDRRL